MLDFLEVKKYTDQQLQERLSMIERKFGGTGNQGAIDLLIQMKDVILMEIDERRMLESLKYSPPRSISLTVDDLSRKEDEERNKQQKD